MNATLDPKQVADPHAGTPVLQAGAPLDKAKLAVVLLHGRGASAEDILGLGEAFSVPDVAFIAPQAAGHTWYPQSFLAPREANEPYLSSALAKIESIVASLAKKGFGPDRIVIAGFSQGACLSTEFVASHPAKYAGLIAFTGGLIGAPGTKLSGTGVSGSPLAGTPALLLSGDPDPHVPWTRVEESAAMLRQLGAEVTTKRYPGRPHTITQDEIWLGRDLLRQALA
ncbi:phospholipase/carboxylesterase/glyoxalase family protein [Bryocella elongata]|uniref:Phospholipase/carboxylesterase/glyoxalase family protein n=1 Tax=Bryocella elongata TaxID=863522 RepID=A0A1H6CBM2_9BACT|nr:alpha/beta hydrolase [Bryocella elongata]SEG70334.1 phospholipase/carboxylesterase/glyoxalase family protein [Bryocella elongata]